MFSEFPSCARHWAKGPKHVLSFSPQSHPLACPLGTLCWLAMLKWHASSHPENKWWVWGHTGSFCLLSSCYFYYATFLYKDRESRGGEYCRNRQKDLFVFSIQEDLYLLRWPQLYFLKKILTRRMSNHSTFRVRLHACFSAISLSLGKDLLKNRVLTSFCLSIDCWGAQCFYHLFSSMAVFCVL